MIKVWLLTEIFIAHALIFQFKIQVNLNIHNALMYHFIIYVSLFGNRISMNYCTVIFFLIIIQDYTYINV